MNDSNFEAAMRRLLEGEPMILFDLETTGLNKERDRILSFSAVKLLMQDGALKEVDREDFLVNPGREIPAEVSAINHITDDMVKGCPEEKEAAEIIRSFLGENPFLCGYNSINFDEGFLDAMYRRVYGGGFCCRLHLDVMRLAKETMRLDSYRLCRVAEYLGVANGITFHRSIDDVLATWRVLEALMQARLDRKREEPDVRIIRATLWQGALPEVRRVYVHTDPGMICYYDVARNTWVTDGNVSPELIRGRTLAYYHCDNEKEMMRKIKVGY